MRIHVTEEARHLSFARHYLKREVPKLNPVKRFAVSIQAPITLGIMSGLMLRRRTACAAGINIPKAVMRKAYGTPESRAEGIKSLRKVRTFCVELGW